MGAAQSPALRNSLTSYAVTDTTRNQPLLPGTVSLRNGVLVSFGMSAVMYLVRRVVESMVLKTNLDGILRGAALSGCLASITFFWLGVGRGRFAFPDILASSFCAILPSSSYNLRLVLLSSPLLAIFALPMGYWGRRLDKKRAKIYFGKARSEPGGGDRGDQFETHGIGGP